MALAFGQRYGPIPLRTCPQPMCYAPIQDASASVSGGCRNLRRLVPDFAHSGLVGYSSPPGPTTHFGENGDFLTGTKSPPFAGLSRGLLSVLRETFRLDGRFGRFFAGLKIPWDPQRLRLAAGRDCEDRDLGGPATRSDPACALHRICRRSDLDLSLAALKRQAKHSAVPKIETARMAQAWQIRSSGSLPGKYNSTPSAWPGIWQLSDDINDEARSELTPDTRSAAKGMP